MRFRQIINIIIKHHRAKISTGNKQKIVRHFRIHSISPYEKKNAKNIMHHYASNFQTCIATYLLAYYFHYRNYVNQNCKMHSICTPRCQIYLLLVTQNAFQYASMCQYLVTCNVMTKEQKIRENMQLCK